MDIKFLILILTYGHASTQKKRIVLPEKFVEKKPLASSFERRLLHALSPVLDFIQR